MKHVCKKEAIQLVKERLVEQITEMDEYPFYYSVIQFGFYDDYGMRLPYETIEKYYDKTEVSRTCRLIRNKIREALEPLQQYYLLETHQPLVDDYGDTIREGRFHINLLISPITDESVLQPNRKCRRLLSEPDYNRFGLPIENQTYSDIEDYKIALINACIRQCQWVNKYRYSIKTQLVETPEDLDTVGNYCLKTYKSGDKDFMDIVEFSSSDFYSK
jgi:hypothetical protein